MAELMNTEQVVKALTDATLGRHAGEREKLVFSESLRALVRLAKAEKLLEIHLDVQLATGVRQVKG